MRRLVRINLIQKLVCEYCSETSLSPRKINAESTLDNENVEVFAPLATIVPRYASLSRPPSITSCTGSND